jgi:precorrin-6B methylase 2
MRVPIELEAAIRDALRAVLGDAVLATGALTKAIVDRSQRYTSDRDRLSAPRDPDGDLAARAAFFTIADAMKIALPILELARRHALPGVESRPLRVLDVGAGCGAMTLGLIATLNMLALDAKLEVTAIDRDGRALDIAKRAITAFAAKRSRAVTITTRSTDATRGELPAADLVVMGTVLNELPPEAALALVERAFAAVSPDGALIAIEPALRETSRGLHTIRDLMIARQAHVFAPCTRRCVPCTALVDPSDWCHEDRALDLPPQTRELARLTHLRDSGMKFSYLVLRKQPLDLVEAGSTAWRAVSAPFVEKGKRELIGCGERGRVPLRLLKRHRSVDNRDFERADRGDVIVTPDEPDEKRLELTGPLEVVRAEPSSTSSFTA